MKEIVFTYIKEPCFNVSRLEASNYLFFSKPTNIELRPGDGLISQSGVFLKTSSGFERIIAGPPSEKIYLSHKNLKYFIEKYYESDTTLPRSLN